MKYLGHTYTKELFTAYRNADLVVDHLQAGSRVGETDLPLLVLLFL